MPSPSLALAAGAAVAAPAPPPAPRPTGGFATALEARLPAARAPRPPPPPPTPPPAQALRAVEAAQARLDAVLTAARSGRTFTAAELLGLQAEAYRLSQALDVAGKLVEHGVQGVRQAVQTQV